MDVANLAGITAIPPMTPLVLDFKERTATAVINVEVYEGYTSGTGMKIKKGALAFAGMHIGDGENGATISAIDKTNEDYDELTLDSDFGDTVEAGTVLFETTAADGTEKKAKANALNYAWTKVEEGATVTAVGQAYEIRTSRLIAPISEADKESLGDRFMFTY